MKKEIRFKSDCQERREIRTFVRLHSICECGSLTLISSYYDGEDSIVNSRCLSCGRYVQLRIVRALTGG
jgi:transcription elongation factor Elf1